MEQRLKLEDVIAQESEKKVSATRKNFQVVIRVRPPLDAEFDRESQLYRRMAQESDAAYGEPGPSVVVEKNRTVTLYEGGVNLWKGNNSSTGLLNMYKFTFDTVLTPEVEQEEMYEKCAQKVVLSTAQGYNGTVLAYGQTGSGKTHTIQV